MSRPEKRSRVARLYLEQLCQVSDELAQLYELAIAFLTLVRERRGEDLDAWRVQAMSSGIEPLVRFAEGLQLGIKESLSQRGIEADIQTG